MLIPVVAIVCGVIIHLHRSNKTDGHLPRIYARYGVYNASVAIVDGEVVEGSLPNQQLSSLRNWLKSHKSDVLEKWQLTQQSEASFGINPR